MESACKEDDYFDVDVSDDEFSTAGLESTVPPNEPSSKPITTSNTDMMDVDMKPMSERLAFPVKDQTAPDVEKEPEDKHPPATLLSENRRKQLPLFKPFHVAADNSAAVVGREIAFRLGEKKTQLIAKVVEVLGYHATVEMFKETKRIEQNGGLKTTDGQRRRSPGGVFLYIMKEYHYATPTQISEIYKVDKEIMKDALKEKKKRQNQKRKAGLRALKKELVPAQVTE